MVDKHLLDRIELVLGRLSAPIALYDKDTESLNNSRFLPFRGMADGICQAYDGMLYLPMNQPAVVLACPESTPGASDLLTLAEALVTNLSAVDAKTENSYDVYRRILRGDLAGADLAAFTHEYRLPEDLPRCALVFHIVETEQETAFNLLENITPLEDADVLIDIDRHTVALVKDMTQVDGETELIQYCMALQETLMEETAHQMSIGIGRQVHRLEKLQDSFLDGRRAIEVGRVFRPEDRVYVFERMIVERFLLEMPLNVGARYQELLFNAENEDLFDDEMVYSLDMYLRQDLNLSDAARRLYIHRNTLVYRLDKVKKLTGYDLRTFNDAMTFKILLEMRKRVKEQHKNK